MPAQRTHGTHALNLELENPHEFLCVLHACPVLPSATRQSKTTNRMQKKRWRPERGPLPAPPRDPTAPMPVGSDPELQARAIIQQTAICQGVHELARVSLFQTVTCRR